MKWFKAAGVTLVILLGTNACTSQPKQAENNLQEPAIESHAASNVQRTFPKLMENPNPNGIVSVYDPLEPFNRTMYNFNYRFDKYVFLPVVSGYEYITPGVVQNRVTNFFANLKEIPYLINNLLQFELADTGITTARFLINSTVGVLGLWDVATAMDINARREDFGLTLSKWGVDSGAYLVLPILGPSSVRDAGGVAFDMVTYNEAVTNGLLDLDDANKDGTRVALALLNATDTRKNTAFRYYETGSPFEYELIRYAYLRKRMMEAEAGQHESDDTNNAK